ncbi:MAG: hypothetical protein ACLUDU_01915 [Butyricimonas faecihominis]
MAGFEICCGYSRAVIVRYLLVATGRVEEQSQMTMHKRIVPGGYKATLITAQGKAITLLPSAEEDIRVQENFVVKNGQKVLFIKIRKRNDYITV